MKRTEVLDQVFSEYIRLRDSKGSGFKTFKCISCGRILPFAMADCGHFMKRGNMATRWDEDNCAAQCISCNRYRDGNVENFEKALILKFGEDKVQEIIQRSHQCQKYSKSEIEDLIKYYRGKIKELKL